MSVFSKEKAKERLRKDDILAQRHGERREEL